MSTAVLLKIASAILLRQKIQLTSHLRRLKFMSQYYVLLFVARDAESFDVSKSLGHYFLLGRLSSSYRLAPHFQEPRRESLASPPPHFEPRLVRLEWPLSLVVVHVGLCLAFVALPSLRAHDFALVWMALEPQWGLTALHHSPE